MPLNWPRSYSDTQYILVLFWLISVVLFLVFLIFFVYWQGNLAQVSPNINKTDVWDDIPTIDEVRQNLYQNTSPPSSQTATSTISPSRIDTNIGNAVNSRDSDELLKLHGRSLIERYFQAIQDGEYRVACSLLSRSLCNSNYTIYPFTQFLDRTNGGYTIKNISLAQEQKSTEAIYCIEYTYTLRADLNPKPITEYFQFRIQARPDGWEEISARVCEKIIKDWRERPCPIITPKKYCQ